MTASSYEGRGMDEVWQLICNFTEKMKLDGWFNHNRREQNKHWMHEWIAQELKRRFYHHEVVAQKIGNLEEEVMQETRLPITAASELLEAYEQKMKEE